MYSCLICISYVIIWFKLSASWCLKVWSVFTEERANSESLPNLLPPTKYTRPNRRKPEDSAVVELGVVAHNMWSITPGSMPRATKTGWIFRENFGIFGAFLGGNSKGWGRSEWWINLDSDRWFFLDEGDILFMNFFSDIQTFQTHFLANQQLHWFFYVTGFVFDTAHWRGD